MAVYTKHPFSGADSGLPILVTGTASAGSIEIHTVGATATDALEAVSLWALSAATSHATPLRAQFLVESAGNSGIVGVDLFSANATGPFDEDITKPLVVFSGLTLTATTTMISAFATATMGFYVWGHVDRIATG